MSLFGGINEIIFGCTTWWCLTEMGLFIYTVWSEWPSPLDTGWGESLWLPFPIHEWEPSGAASPGVCWQCLWVSRLHTGIIDPCHCSTMELGRPENGGGLRGLIAVYGHWSSTDAGVDEAVLGMFASWVILSKYTLMCWYRVNGLHEPGPCADWLAGWLPACLPAHPRVWEW